MCKVSQTGSFTKSFFNNESVKGKGIEKNITERNKKSSFSRLGKVLKRVVNINIFLRAFRSNKENLAAQVINVTRISVNEASCLGKSLTGVNVKTFNGNEKSPAFMPCADDFFRSSKNASDTLPPPPPPGHKNAIATDRMQSDNTAPITEPFATSPSAEPTPSSTQPTPSLASSSAQPAPPPPPPLPADNFLKPKEVIIIKKSKNENSGNATGIKLGSFFDGLKEDEVKPVLKERLKLMRAQAEEMAQERAKAEAEKEAKKREEAEQKAQQEAAEAVKRERFLKTCVDGVPPPPSSPPPSFSAEKQPVSNERLTETVGDKNVAFIKPKQVNPLKSAADDLLINELKMELIKREEQKEKKKLLKTNNDTQ